MYQCEPSFYIIMVGSGQEKVPLAFFALFCRNNAWGVLLERSEGQKFFLSLREPMYKRVQPLRALFGDLMLRSPRKCTKRR